MVHGHSGIGGALYPGDELYRGTGGLAGELGHVKVVPNDSKIVYRTINARAETVDKALDKAPSYRQAFIKRCCLIPADGFYEWRKTAKTEAAVRNRHERRPPIHLCWALGKLERSQIWRVDTHLHDYGFHYHPNQNVR
jgi:hypothetical protein